MHSEKLKAYAAWGTVSIFWGTTYLAIRVGVEVLPPALFAGIRFAIAGLIFIPILILRGYALPTRKELGNITVVAILLLTIANGSVVWAEQWLPSSLAALIVATLPFCMVGMESLLPKGDRLSSKKILGIVIGFLGLILLLWPDLKGTMDPAYLKGVLVILIAPLSWAGGSLYSKYRTIQTKPLMAAAVQMLIAGIILTTVGVTSGELHRFTLDPKGLVAVGYLVIFGSLVGYSSYIYALAHLPASVVSTHAYVNPVIAVILGWLLLGERLDWLVLGATATILLGVVLVQTSSSQKSPLVHSVMSEKVEQETVV